MSKLSFSSLPDVCLLLVFDKIALDDLLLNVNLVNRHWNTISTVASQHRKRLVLSLLYNLDDSPFDLIINSVFTDPFEGSQCKDRYFGGEHESLIVRDAQLRVNRQRIERLIQKLPNIATLEVNLNDLSISASEHLVTLINGWRENLVTLKLFTFYHADPNQSLLVGLAQLTNLHTTINSLPVLHHLTYQLDFPFNKIDLIDRLYRGRNHDRIQLELTFPISCPSLKELYFTSRNFVEDDFDKSKRLFSNAFRDYVQSEEASGLRKIACYVPAFNDIDKHLATSNVLSSKTSHIELNGTFTNDVKITETKLMDFCRKFYNLTNISYEIDFSFTVDKLSKCLSILENLKHITFTYCGSTEDEEFEEMWLENNNSDPDRVLPQMDKIIPLIRIKSVYLDLVNIRWHQLLAEDLRFDLVFPNVELVSINNDYYSCAHCGGYFDTEMRETTRKFEWRNCIGQFLAPIAKCDKLKRIEYENEEEFKFYCTLEQFKLDWEDFID